MNNKLRDYILAEAAVDWTVDRLIHTESQENSLCDFVERMVLDALIDSQVAKMYLDETNDNF